MGLDLVPIWGVARVSGTWQCRCPKKGACPSPGKHPIGKFAPQGANSPLRDLAELNEVLQEFPEANIGIVTDGLVVADVDHPDQAPDFPPTLTATTGRSRGRHYYYRAPPAEGRKYSWGDRKGGRGHLVVAPPSRHVSGGRYELVDAAQPITDAPAWLLEPPPHARRSGPRRASDSQNAELTARVEAETDDFCDRFPEPHPRRTRLYRRQLPDELAAKLHETTDRSASLASAYWQIWREAQTSADGDELVYRRLAGVWDTPAGAKADENWGWDGLVADYFRTTLKPPFLVSDWLRHVADATPDEPWNAPTPAETRVLFAIGVLLAEQRQWWSCDGDLVVACRASHLTIAERAGVSLDTAKKRLRRLAQIGWLKKVRCPIPHVAATVWTFDAPSLSQPRCQGCIADFAAIKFALASDALRAPALRQNFAVNFLRATLNLPPTHCDPKLQRIAHPEGGLTDEWKENLELLADEHDTRGLAAAARRKDARRRLQDRQAQHFADQIRNFERRQQLGHPVKIERTSDRVELIDLDGTRFIQTNDGEYCRVLPRRRRFR